MDKTPTCIYQARNVCGESPVWDAADQALYWSDIPLRKIMQYDRNGKVTVRTVPSDIGAFALRRSGGMIAGTRSGVALIELTHCTAEIIADPAGGEARIRFNDGKCDRQGRFWCGTCDEEADPSQRRPIASLYRIDPNLTCHRLLDGIRTSNGIDWSPDGRTMYYTDTPTLRIDAFDFDPDFGTLSNRRVFVEIEPGTGRPDGLTVDAEGYVWSAHFDGWRITRYAPDGGVDAVIRLPVRHVTSCAFGGAGLDLLYITTATEDLTAEELAAQPLAGGLFAMRPGARGLPMARFAG